MKTTATVTGPTGDVKLTFGVYSLKNFCKRMGCEPDINSVLSAFQGGTRAEAIVEMVRSGVEQSQAEAGEQVRFSDFAACELIEHSTGEQADKAMKALFSSILNEDYDEWFERLIQRVEEAKAKDAAAETPTESTDQGEKKSSTGTKSNPKPTEKSA